MCISFQLQPVPLTRLVNISCMFGVQCACTVHVLTMDITNPYAQSFILAGRALFEQYLMRPCQAKGVQECFKTTLEEWLHLNSYLFLCNYVENMKI